MFHCLSVCLPEVTHRKRHNRLKSKKLEEKRREREKHNRFKSKNLACYCAAGSRYVNTMLCRHVTVLHVCKYYAAGMLPCCR